MPPCCLGTPPVAARLLCRSKRQTLTTFCKNASKRRSCNVFGKTWVLATQKSAKKLHSTRGRRGRHLHSNRGATVEVRKLKGNRPGAGTCIALSLPLQKYCRCISPFPPRRLTKHQSCMFHPLSTQPTSLQTHRAQAQTRFGLRQKAQNRPLFDSIPGGSVAVKRRIFQPQTHPAIRRTLF